MLALKAIVAYRLKDNDTAVRDAQAALKIEPGNVDALVVLAADRLANNDPKAALQYLSANPQFQDKDLGTQLFKLKIYEQLKDYPQLEALLKTLAQRYPQNVAFRKQLVDLYMGQHRSEDAEKELRELANADPKNSQLALELIRFLFVTKGPAAARDEILARINAGGEIFPYQLALAELEYDQGKVQDSFALLQKLISAGPATQTATAQVMLAELDLRQKNPDAAEKLVDDILSNDSRNIDALKLRATIRLDRDQVDAAIADLREALNDQPRSPSLMRMLAQAYERGGRIDLADKQFADALKASNYNPVIGLDYAAFLQRRSNQDQASRVLNELVNRWPNNVTVLTAMAEMQLSQHDFAGAQQTAERIQRLGNTNAVSYQILGAALSGEHKYDDSVTAFQQAVAAAPSAVPPMAALVGALVNAKHTDKAIAYLQSVLKDHPDNAEAYVLLGNVDASNNMADEAEKNFKAAISSQPKSDIGYQALAALYTRQNKVDAALDTIKAGLTEQPDDLNLHLSSAGILELQKNYDGAISEYESLLKEQPNSLIVINNLASLLADHRTDQASLDQAERLAASLRDSEVAQFKDTLGWVYYRQGDFKASVPLLEEAAASLPGSALVRYHLAMSYIGAGQLAKAADQFKQALNQTSDSDLQAKIKAGLKNTGTQ